MDEPVEPGRSRPERAGRLDSGVVDWTDAEKQQNPIRRGMVVPSENGHALNY